jgi:hypothetical protein
MAVCYFLDKRCAILLTAPGTFEDVTDFRFVPRDGHVERARAYNVLLVSGYSA